MSVSEKARNFIGLAAAPKKSAKKPAAKNVHKAGTAPKPTTSVGDYIKRIAKQTDNNDHNGSVHTLARMMGDSTAKSVMSAVMGQHNEAGHMSQDLLKVRDGVRKQLLKKAKIKYKPETYAKIHGAF